MLFSERHTILVASLVILLPMMLIEGLKTDLTQRELKEKYGQGKNTTIYISQPNIKKRFNFQKELVLTMAKVVIAIVMAKE